MFKQTVEWFPLLVSVCQNFTSGCLIFSASVTFHSQWWCLYPALRIVGYSPQCNHRHSAEHIKRRSAHFNLESRNARRTMGQFEFLKFCGGPVDWMGHYDVPSSMHSTRITFTPNSETGETEEKRRSGIVNRESFKRKFAGHNWCS